MRIRPIKPADRSEWLRMRTELWPESPEDHPREVDHYFERAGEELATFVAENDVGDICGVIEVATRPYAEGCVTSPVAYVEGWWVEPEYRKQGVGRALVSAAENWARELGLTEIASDAELANTGSIEAHCAIGFQETDRIVCFRKEL